ncbi:protein kinase [Pendulispora rubella]|uniref:Protein kinase n=1 Tax=Pendulispora rubella TaxID=2741070 RepID=A0ABZ2L0A7_9BACT
MAPERTTRREVPILREDAVLRLRAAAHDESLEPGTVFADRYVIQGCLGKGGMGLLFRAFDMHLERQIALKILHTDTGWSLESNPRTRILREARAAAALTHWNVVTIHDVGEHDGIAFMAMEYVPGDSLAASVRKNLAPFEVRLRWMKHVAQVLEAAHARGLIHRDIKPENVMITRQGEVKVLDFGIARYGEDETSTWIVGTPGYMPPEQNRGEWIDARADQFAWAVTAYEAFSGEMPWKKVPGDQDTDYGAPKPLGDAVPPHIAAVLDRALSMRPAERFASMRDLLAALEAPVPAPRPRAPKRRDPTRSLMALLVVMVLVHGLGLLRKPPAPTAARRVATPSACTRGAHELVAEGLSSMRDANWGPAHDAFEKAVAADPSCAPARLYLVVTGEAYYPIVEEREQVQRAQRLREALSEREALVLDAWTSIVVSEPPDREAAVRALDEGVRQFPHDAELLALAAAVRVHSGSDAISVERGLALARQASAIDPKSANAWQVQSAAAWRLRRVDEARVALDKCLELSPGSADCIADRSSLLSSAGECTEAADEARHAISKVLTSRRAHRQLAYALAAAGAPEDDVHAALRDYWMLLPEASRKAARLHDLARLSVSYGRFDDAENFATELAREVASDPSLAPHQRAAETLVELYAETGRQAQAATTAQTFLHLKDAWTGADLDTRSENQDMGFGHEPSMLAALFRAGEAADPWEPSTEAWDKRARKIMGARDAWAYRFEPVADRPGIAEEAWRNRPPPSDAGLPGGWGMASPVGLSEGHIALRAGEANEAMSLLEPATRTCRMLEAPFAQIRAHQWLGEAKERTGDIAGACDAYSTVLRHWGDSKPESSTAAAARARSRDLGCAIDRRG